jgi:hypothetical protein
MRKNRQNAPFWHRNQPKPEYDIALLRSAGEPKEKFDKTFGVDDFERPQSADSHTDRPAGNTGGSTLAMAAGLRLPVAFLRAVLAIIS